MFVFSGWGRFYNNRSQFVGTVNYTDPDYYHFPGIHPEAAEWLGSSRNISGVGIDVASLDNGPSKRFEAHVNFFKRNIWGAEIVANMEKLPPTGARVSVLPMKIKGGSGAPSRIYATWSTTNVSGTCHPKSFALAPLVWILTRLLY